MSNMFNDHSYWAGSIILRMAYRTKVSLSLCNTISLNMTQDWGLLQFLGTDDSGPGTHRELDDLGRERPLGSTLAGNDLPPPGTIPGR